MWSFHRIALATLQLPLRTAITAEVLWILPSNLFVEYQTHALALAQQHRETGLAGPTQLHSLLSFIPQLMTVFGASVLVFVLAHAIINGHRVMNRHRQLTHARKQRAKGAASSSTMELTPQPVCCFLRPLQCTVTMLSNWTEANSVLQYLFEPLELTQVEQAQEADLYYRIAGVLSWSPIVIAVACGSVIASTFVT
jgi:hypothetical protein